MISIGIYMIVIPIILAVVLGLFTPSKSTIAKYIALLIFGSMLSESISLLNRVPKEGFLNLGNYLKVENFPFELTLQVDTLSTIMLILTSLLLILVTLSSWNQKSSRYFALLIMFSGFIYGLFMSTNLLWFFIFWELTLIPMYFLIGIWGAEGRIYAAIKFFLYTHFASMLILLALFLIYSQTEIMDISLLKESMMATPALVWWLMFIGFAVKMPIFPFHTWLPDAHVQAPAPISVLLAGVLLKMGAYALIRFNILIMPQSAKEFAWILLVLGTITIFYAGFMALYEKHLKKMVAYSSISHMGLVAVGISTLTQAGLSASLYEMIGHALIISPLFLIAGILHQKTSSWLIEDMGGLMQKAPYISTIFVIAGLAALGLPGTMGFIGEISILIASIKSWGLIMSIVALGSMVGAGYIIWSFRRVIYGEISYKIANSRFEISMAEKLSLGIFAILIILFGIVPSTLFVYINQAFSAIANTGGIL